MQNLIFYDIILLSVIEVRFFMNKQMQAKFDEFAERKKKINVEWFERFFNMLEKSGLDEKTILDAMDFAFSEEMSANYKIGGHRNVLNKDIKAKNTHNEFFAYMSDMAKKLGPEKFKDFLENSLKEMQKDYDKYVKEGHSAKTNFVNLFMRRLVIQNPQDLKLEHLGAKVEEMEPEKNEGRFDAVIAGVSVGHIEFDEEKGSSKVMRFCEFRTSPGLERLGIGAYLFKALCQEVSTKKPEHAIIAWSVAKGKDGSKAYSVWGGYPIKSAYSDETGRHIIGRMSDSEYEESRGPFIFYFSPEMVKKNSQKDIKKYKLQLLNNESQESPQSSM